MRERERGIGEIRKTGVYMYTDPDAVMVDYNTTVAKVKWVTINELARNLDKASDWAKCLLGPHG